MVAARRSNVLTSAIQGTAASPKLATAADLAKLGEDARVEIIGGAFVQKAAPSYEHGDAQSAIAEFLKPPYQRGRGGPGGWWIGSEVEVELFENEVYLPDMAGWRRDRVPERPRGRPIRIRPDWVCEVLSPSNFVNDLGVKFATYHRAGVDHYWVLDPMKETLTVYRRTADSYESVLEAGRDDVVRAEPFDAIELTLVDFFGGETTPPAEPSTGEP